MGALAARFHLFASCLPHRLVSVGKLTKLVLIGYVAPLVVLVISTLLIRDKIPPNRILGFRTEETLSDPELWYPANRVLGRCTAVAAIASLAFNLALWWAVPEWPLDRITSWTTAGTVIPLVVAVLWSVRDYLRPP